MADEEKAAEHALPASSSRLRLRLFACAMALWITAGLVPLFVADRSILAELSGCFVSFVCAAIILGTYGRAAGYRRHPNKLIVYKTCSDACLVGVVVLALIYSRARCGRDSDCASDAYARLRDGPAVPFFTQLFMVSSEAWFFVLLVDLRRAVKNPFYSFTSTFYRVCVWTVASASAILLVALPSHLLYLPHNASFRDEDPPENPSAIVLPRNLIYFYLPLSVVYAVAVHTLYVVKVRLARGLSSTFGARVRIAAVSVLTILTYLAYWIVYFGLAAAVCLLHKTYRRTSRLYLIWSFHRTTKCWWDLLVWLLANDPRLFELTATKVLSSFCRLSRRQAVSSADEEDPNNSLGSMSPSLSQSFLRSSSFMSDETDASALSAAATNTRRSRRKQQRRRLYDDDDNNFESEGAFVDVNAQLRPQTNDAMQTELLYYVTSGIRQAARASATAVWRSEEDDDDDDKDDDRPIHLKRRDVGKVHLSLWSLIALFFVDDDLDVIKRQRPSDDPKRSTTISQQQSLLFGEEQEYGIPDPLTSLDNGDDDEVSSRPSAASTSSKDSRRFRPRHSSWSTHADHRHQESLLGEEQVPVVESSDDSRATDDIVFVDHKAQTFRRIREHFGIRLEDYVSSFRSTQKERFTEGGSSDAFFFYSGDERFMVKTCTATEFFTLLQILKDYAEYVCTHRNTFLVRLIGAHCLHLYENVFYFLVMENVLHFVDNAVSGGGGNSSPADQRPVAISQTRFDIKGSWVNRAMVPPRKGQRLTCQHCNRKYTFVPRTLSRRSSRAGPHATIRRTRSNPVYSLHQDHYDETFCPVTVGGEHAPNITLKDNDLNYSHRLRLERSEALEVVRQLRADAKLLAALGIMDYSLLLGVQTVEYPAPPDAPHPLPAEGAPTTSSETPRAVSFEGCERSHSGHRRSHVVVRNFYFFGIIDILQRWTLAKRLELWWKVHVRGYERDGMSCQPPNAYCARFQAKMAELILPNQRTGGFTW